MDGASLFFPATVMFGGVGFYLFIFKEKVQLWYVKFRSGFWTFGSLQVFISRVLVWAQQAPQPTERWINLWKKWHIAGRIKTADFSKKILGKKDFSQRRVEEHSFHALPAPTKYWWQISTLFFFVKTKNDSQLMLKRSWQKARFWTKMYLEKQNLTIAIEKTSQSGWPRAWFLQQVKL